LRRDVPDGNFRPQQYGYPARAFMVLAGELHSHGERHTQDGAHQTQRSSPEDQRKKDYQRRKVEFIAHQLGLNHVAEHEINGYVTGPHQRGAAGAELDKREADRRDPGDDRADMGDIEENFWNTKPPLKCSEFYLPFLET